MKHFSFAEPITVLSAMKETLIAIVIGVVAVVVLFTTLLYALGPKTLGY